MKGQHDPQLEAMYNVTSASAESRFYVHEKQTHSYPPGFLPFLSRTSFIRFLLLPLREFEKGVERMLQLREQGQVDGADAFSQHCTVMVRYWSKRLTPA